MSLRIVLSGLVALSSVASFAGQLGGGFGFWNMSVDDPKVQQAQRWSLAAPMWSFKFVDPSGSLLSAMGAATSNYSRQLGAQQEAEREAAKDGYGEASYELKTSVSSTGSTQILEVLWAHDGELEYSDDAGKVVDEAPENLTLQMSLSGIFMPQTHLFGTPVSVVPYWKGIIGYYDFTGKGKLGYNIEDNQAWFTFPVGASAVIDGPFGTSARAFAGYDPVTGLISIWSANVHQAFEYGAAAEWTPLDWLVGEVGFTAATTNVDNNNLWAFETTALNFGARIDFDGF